MSDRIMGDRRRRMSRDVEGRFAFAAQGAQPPPCWKAEMLASATLVRAARVARGYEIFMFGVI